MFTVLKNRVVNRQDDEVAEKLKKFKKYGKANGYRKKAATTLLGNEHSEI